MRVEVDYDRCEGHSECVRVAPTVFRISDDDEQVRVINPSPDESLWNDVRLAAGRCPRQAIHVDP